MYKTPHAAPLIPSAIPSKIRAADFIGKFRPPENSSYRVQSPRIAASPTLFASTVDEATLARAKKDTVKSQKTFFPSDTYVTLLRRSQAFAELSIPSTAFRKKISSTRKAGQLGTRPTAPSATQSGYGQEGKYDQSERQIGGFMTGRGRERVSSPSVMENRQGPS